MILLHCINDNTIFPKFLYLGVYHMKKKKNIYPQGYKYYFGLKPPKNVKRAVRVSLSTLGMKKRPAH